MLSYCRSCNQYHADMILSDDDSTMTCPNCKQQQPLRGRPPLFIITGASGVGKSTLSAELYKAETEYIVMEGDILWCDFFNTPQDDYRRFRETWLRLCKNISQAGKPVVLCGCCTPEQYDCCTERRYFSDIFYLAVVCAPDELERRMREGRLIQNEEAIQASVRLNQWLLTHAERYSPPITLLHSDQMTLHEAVEFADAWILDGVTKNSAGPMCSRETCSIPQADSLL